MEADVVQYELKIKKLLEKFLESDFQLNNDTYINVLLSHLTGKENKELGEALANLPTLSEWILHALNHWESTNTIPSQTITVFTLHLASILSKNEIRFITFNSSNVYMRICSVLKVRVPNASPSIKLAYINLLMSFLDHKSGIEWLISTDNWKDALNFCLASQTIYIIKEGHSFMYNLLRKSVNYNEIFCDLVVEKIMDLLTNFSLPNGSICGTPEVNDERLKKEMTPTIRLVSFVLESCLQNEFHANKDVRIPIIFLTKYNLEKSIGNLMLIAQDEEFSFDVNKVMFLIYFFQPTTKQEPITIEEIKNTCRSIFKLLNVQITKESVINMLKLSYVAQTYWKYMKTLINCIHPIQDPPQTFEGQIIALQLLPILVVSFAQCDMKLNPEDDFRENFIIKIFKTLRENTIRMIYNWRTALSLHKNLVDNGHKGILYILKNRQQYTREEGVIVFQCLLYTLEDIITCIKKKPESIELFTKHESYLCSLFDAIATFIKDFDITWRQCVETICVMSVSMDFIASYNWPPKLVVKALRLVNVSIEMFMTPNLALLVDRTNDSTMALLEPMLTAKLHDMNWEVRDSALEVLHTISGIALTKFPSFQSMVINSDLLKLAVVMSTCDGESFVRASAIKCLQEMIKVPAFWNDVLEQQNLPEKIIHILRNETEAIVRCEAASLMCLIYEHQQIPHDLMDKIYETMVCAAIVDLHWEVKVNTLCFWKKVINKCLTNQGMIDGTFPTVTFSKEHRKIVTLTEKEIKTRLNKVLMELSKFGCLAVLVAAIEDECDLEVSKKAVEVTTILIELLNTYNISSDSTSNSPISPKAVMDTFNLVGSAPTSPTENMSDSIIDQIINSKDIQLLTTVYASEQNVPVTNGDPRPVKIVTPQSFLRFIQADLDALIAERQKWLNKIDDLGSLLDDMLKTYDSDINSMDCY